MALDERESPIRVVVPPALDGRRLDTALAVLLPDYSRSRLQRFIREGQVRLDGRVPECSDKVPAGAAVELDPPAPPEVAWKAQPIPLVIVHEDSALLVIDKPPGNGCPSRGGQSRGHPVERGDTPCAGSRGRPQGRHRPPAGQGHLRASWWWPRAMPCGFGWCGNCRLGASSGNTWRWCGAPSAPAAPSRPPSEDIPVHRTRMSVQAARQGSHEPLQRESGDTGTTRC